MWHLGKRHFKKTKSDCHNIPNYRTSWFTLEYDSKKAMFPNCCISNQQQAINPVNFNVIVIYAIKSMIPTRFGVSKRRRVFNSLEFAKRVSHFIHLEHMNTLVSGAALRT